MSKYTPQFFDIRELVPRHVWMDRGDKAWELLDDRLLMALDHLRELHGAITVNNWHKGGSREWSGLRTERSPYGTMYSQHRFGRAADCLFHAVTVDFVRDDILLHPEDYPLINSVELDTTWLHFDVRNCNRIKTYTP